MKEFAIFCGARTGSTSLFHMLHAFNENMVFEPFHPRIWRPKDGDTARVKRKLGSIYRRNNGIKHLYDHLDLVGNIVLLLWLQARGVSIVRLMRENLALRVLSREIAVQTGFWLSTSDQKEAYLHLEKLDAISIDSIKAQIAGLIYLESIYGALIPRKCALRIRYEDLFGRDRGRSLRTARWIFNFLEMDAPTGDAMAKFVDPCEKQNTSRIYRLIPNIAEIEYEFGLSLTTGDTYE